MVKYCIIVYHHQNYSVKSNNRLIFISDMNSQDNMGNTPLHLAVENEAIDAIRFLLEM